MQVVEGRPVTFGWLLKSSPYIRNWRKRFVVIADGHLIVRQKREENSSVKLILPLIEVQSVEYSGVDKGGRHMLTVQKKGKRKMILATTTKVREEMKRK